MKKITNYRIGKLLRLGFIIVPETQIELRYPGFFFQKDKIFWKRIFVPHRALSLRSRRVYHKIRLAPDCPDWSAAARRRALPPPWLASSD